MIAFGYTNACKNPSTRKKALVRIRPTHPLIEDRAMEPLLGLRHLALRVEALDTCLAFYQNILGFRIDWQPDEDNVYLTSGSDNLALHRAEKTWGPITPLDHIGFALPTARAVHEWYQHLLAQKVPIAAAPKHHRDGATSLYCRDPEGTLIQLIYHPSMIEKNDV